MGRGAPGGAREASSVLGQADSLSTAHRSHWKSFPIFGVKVQNQQALEGLLSAIWICLTTLVIWSNPTLSATPLEVRWASTEHTFSVVASYLCDILQGCHRVLFLNLEFILQAYCIALYIAQLLLFIWPARMFVKITHIEYVKCSEEFQIFHTQYLSNTYNSSVKVGQRKSGRTS